ncbi:tail fiber assembly protein, partial [Escherichia coli]
DENGLPVLKSPVIDYVARAENQRMQLLSHADNVTADWRVELMLGDISSTDKEKLSAWMYYKKEVKAVDTSTAPEISWPELPEV